MGWTKEEKQMLIDNYLYMSNSELMNLLNKTEGQLRGMKSRLGLNMKFKPFTEKEKEIIKTYYIENNDKLNLDELSEIINRPKTSISRFAKSEGLTNKNRTLSETAKDNIKKGIIDYHNSDRYTEEIYQKQVEILSYYAKNEHPKGMLNKHHSTETCEQMSISHIELAKNMSYEEKHEIAMKAVATKLKNGGFNTTSNAYSRCKGGLRADLNQYFRSAWEANVARVLNYYNIEWEYEPKRFFFNAIVDGVASYQPDFYLPKLDKWIEIKGWLDEKSKIRLELFATQYPEENSKMILIDENFYNKIKNQFSFLDNWE